MKGSQSTIVLCIFLISTWISGIFFEAIGWGALFLLFYSYRRRGNLAKLDTSFNKNLMIIFVAIVFYIVQVVALNLEVSQIIRLYGITKTVVAFVIVRLFLGPIISIEDIIEKIFPLFLILNFASIILIFKNGETASLLGGSRNYVGAIDVVLIPYVLKFMSNKRKYMRMLWLVTTFLLAMFSGSRTMLLAAIVAFTVATILDKNTETKLKRWLIIILALFLIVIAGNIFSNLGGFSRAISVFSSLADKSRSDLFDSFVVQFGQYNDLQKMIGNGNNLILWREAPPHNFILEILLCFGKIGLVLFLFFTAIVTFKIVKKKKWYAGLTIGLAILINLVQPYITTGYLFQVVMSIACLTIYTKE